MTKVHIVLSLGAVILKIIDSCHLSLNMAITCSHSFPSQFQIILFTSVNRQHTFNFLWLNSLRSGETYFSDRKSVFL